MLTLVLALWQYYPSLSHSVRALNPKPRADCLLFAGLWLPPAAARSLLTSESSRSMDNDMALAAAYAAGAEPPATAFQPQRGPPGGAAPPWGGQGGEEAVMEGELPSVDDLEVAAAAAGVAPVPAVLAELGYTEMGAEHGAGAQAMEASSSGGSSGDDSSSSDDDEGACGARGTVAGRQHGGNADSPAAPNGRLLSAEPTAMAATAAASACC